MRMFVRLKPNIRNLLSLFLLLTATAYGVDWKALKPQGYVSDFAGVIDAQSKAELENCAARPGR